MKKLLIACALLIGSLGPLSGCQSFENFQAGFAYKRGTNVTQEQIKEFTINKSNKNDVITLLGEPQKTSTDGKNEVLEYHYYQINHFSGGVDQTVKFILNKEHILIDTKVIQGSGFGNPLLNG